MAVGNAILIAKIKDVAHRSNKPSLKPVNIIVNIRDINNAILSDIVNPAAIGLCFSVNLLANFWPITLKIIADGNAMSIDKTKDFIH